MAGKVNPIPEGYGSVTPYLCVKGAAAAIELWKKALGAEELFRMPGPGDMVMHAEVKIGDPQLLSEGEFLNYLMGIWYETAGAAQEADARSRLAGARA